MVELLIRIAEFDRRKLYLPEAFPSMTGYCMQRLNLSEDEAWRRLQAAKAGREHPILLEAFADSRRHLSGVCLLAPYLNSENEQELVAAAAGRTMAQIRQLLAERFPQPEMLPVVPEVFPLPESREAREFRLFWERASGQEAAPASSAAIARGSG